MRILFAARNIKFYLAKLHEAFRTGLSRMYDTHFFGKGYPGYNPFLRSYPQIVRHSFKNVRPDLIIADCQFFESVERPFRFKWDNLKACGIPTAMILPDFWDIHNRYKDAFVEFIQNQGISFIFSYFKQPLQLWQNTEIDGRILFLPPCFDPEIFNDWQVSKTYDVGFLGAGTTEKSSNYPDRYEIHRKLLSKKGLKYLYAEHPGWKRFRRPHPLVGVNFSHAINSCKIFITTSGNLQHVHPKIIEALASKTCLFSDEPVGMTDLGLVDGIHYIKITPDTVIDKIDYYLTRPDLIEEIAENGYCLAMQRHTNYARAFDFYKAIAPKLFNHRAD